MLIIAPPSEAKRRSPEAGEPVDVAGLSFPELTAMRRHVIEALIETSASSDAFARLRIRPALAADVARNTRLLDLPTMPAHEVYRGPLHQGLDLGGLEGDGRERAAAQVVITSALWGALRPDDDIPSYRLDLFAGLIGIDRIDHAWRPLLARTLAAAAGDAGLIIDLRSATYRQIGSPAGLGERTVVLRVEQRTPGKRIGDVVAKRVRGEAARVVLESGADPTHPAELADVLGDQWPVELDAPERPGRPWTLSLSVVD